MATLHSAYHSISNNQLILMNAWDIIKFDISSGKQLARINS